MASKSRSSKSRSSRGRGRSSSRSSSSSKSSSKSSSSRSSSSKSRASRGSSKSSSGSSKSSSGSSKSSGSKGVSSTSSSTSRASRGSSSPSVSSSSPTTSSVASSTGVSTMGISTQSQQQGPTRTESAGTFTTASGPVSVASDGVGISPQSEKGQSIQAQYDYQAQRRLNKAEERAYFDAIRNAPNWQEAVKIRDATLRQNPNVPSYNVVRDTATGQIKETSGTTETAGPVKRLDYTKYDRETKSFAEKKSYVIRDNQGNVVATNIQTSPGSSWNLENKPVAKVESMAPQPMNLVSMGLVSGSSSGTTTTTTTSDEYLSDDEKAFEWFPDVPTGDDPGDRALAGVIKGSSNTLASVFNIAAFANEGIKTVIGDKSPPADDAFVPFYSTPITNVESGLFEGVIESVKQGDASQFGKEVGQGFDEAYVNFTKDFVGSTTSTIIEGVPYVATNIFKFAATSIGKIAPKVLGTSGRVVDDIIPGSSSPGPKAATMTKSEAAQASGLAGTKGMQTAEQVSNYFKLTGKIGNIDILPKITTPKPKPKPKAKPEPKAKPTTTTPDVIKIPKNEVLPSKFLNPKKIEPGLPVKPVKPGKPVKPETPGLKITTAPKIGVPSIRGPTTTGPKGPGPTGPSGRPIGFGLPFFGDLFPGGGGDSVGRQGKIRGQRIYKAWNVDTKNIGFLDGPEVKIDTTGEVFSDLDVRQKEKKRKGDFGI